MLKIGDTYNHGQKYPRESYWATAVPCEFPTTWSRRGKMSRPTAKKRGEGTHSWSMKVVLACGLTVMGSQARHVGTLEGRARGGDVVFFAVVCWEALPHHVVLTPTHGSNTTHLVRTMPKNNPSVELQQLVPPHPLLTVFVVLSLFAPCLSHFSSVLLLSSPLPISPSSLSLFLSNAQTRYLRTSELII